MPKYELSSDDQTFKSANFSKESLEGRSFTNCTFENCNFQESIWRGGTFCDCLFKRCNISLVGLEGTRLQNVQFDECKVLGADFHKCDARFFSIHFRKSILIHCNFSGLKMQGASFKESKLKECYFTNTLLNGGDFSEVEFTNTDFHNCNLTKCDFRSATRYSINPLTNDIKKARFSFPEAASLLNYLDIIIS